MSVGSSLVVSDRLFFPLEEWISIRESDEKDKLISSRGIGISSCLEDVDSGSSSEPEIRNESNTNLVTGHHGPTRW